LLILLYLITCLDTFDRGHGDIMNIPPRCQLGRYPRHFAASYVILIMGLNTRRVWFLNLS